MSCIFLLVTYTGDSSDVASAVWRAQGGLQVESPPWSAPASPDCSPYTAHLTILCACHHEAAEPGSV